MDLVWGVKGGGLSGRGNSDRIGGEGGGDAVSRHRGSKLGKFEQRGNKYNERAIVSMCLSGFEPARLRGFTSEVSHTYGIFHYVFKKRAKSNR